MKIQVIETSSNHKRTEWGISFTCNNPNPEDYFKMPNSATAFRIKKKIESKFDNFFRIIEEYDNIYGLIDKDKLIQMLHDANVAKSVGGGK
jgi:hypothetical protein